MTTAIMLGLSVERIVPSDPFFSHFLSCSCLKNGRKGKKKKKIDVQMVLLHESLMAVRGGRDGSQKVEQNQRDFNP